jgi:hypothetical protein
MIGSKKKTLIDARNFNWKFNVYLEGRFPVVFSVFLFLFLSVKIP